MARLSSAFFALIGVASASAAVTDAVQNHNAHTAAHSKIVKVRSQGLAPAPSISSSDATTEDIQQANNGNSDGHDWKRDTKLRFTYYYAGLGACGSINTDADFAVALNSAQFGNGENCYKMINIWHNGKQTQAQIVDECPGCPEGGLDFTPGLFSFFSDLGVGVLYGTWWFA